MWRSSRRSTTSASELQLLQPSRERGVSAPRSPISFAPMTGKSPAQPIWAHDHRVLTFPPAVASERRRASGVLSQARTQCGQFQTARGEVATVATICQACNEKSTMSSRMSVSQGVKAKGWDMQVYTIQLLILSCPHVHIFLTTPPRERAITWCQGGPKGERVYVCLLSETAGHVDMRAKCLIINASSSPKPWTLLGHHLDIRAPNAFAPSCPTQPAFAHVRASSHGATHPFQHCVSPARAAHLTLAGL